MGETRQCNQYARLRVVRLNEIQCQTGGLNKNPNSRVETTSYLYGGDVKIFYDVKIMDMVESKSPQINDDSTSPNECKFTVDNCFDETIQYCWHHYEGCFRQLITKVTNNLSLNE